MRRPVKIYSPLKKYEGTLYAIQDLQLFMPVTYRQIWVFGSSLIFMFILVHLPGLKFLQSWWLINYVLIPLGSAWFFTKFLLDGKNPHRFLWDFILYMFSPGVYSRYEKAESPEKYRYYSAVTYRKGDDKE